MQIKENYSLLKHNTFGLDVKARWFIEYESEEDLKKILSDEYFFSLPYLHIGEGSNLLFLQDYEGVILHSLLKDIEVVREDDEQIWISAGAGNSWDDFVAYCVGKGWGGLENLSLIPGEVGSSAVQNIGAYGVEAKDLIEEVHVYHIDKNEKKVFSNTDCRFAYRESIFKSELKGQCIITRVVFRLSRKPVYNIEYGNLKDILAKDGVINLETVRNAVIAVRRSKLPDPEELGNAGSFFMNPYIEKAKYNDLLASYPNMPSYPVSDQLVKIPAAWLIDQCGLKGKKLGNAAVHEKQPLVIINTGNATGDEIARLAEEVRNTVMTKFGVELRLEVNYI